MHIIMDARVKPGHDTECVIRACPDLSSSPHMRFSPIHLSNSPLSSASQTFSQRSAARIFAQAPGAPAVSVDFHERNRRQIRPTRKKTEGARDARGPERIPACAEGANETARTYGPRRLATSRPVEIRNCRKSAKPSARRTAALRAPLASRARCFEVCSAKSPAVGRSRPAA